MRAFPLLKLAVSLLVSARLVTAQYVKLHKTRDIVLVEPEPNTTSDFIVESDSTHLYLSWDYDEVNVVPLSTPTLYPTKPPRAVTYVTNPPTTSRPTYRPVSLYETTSARYVFLDSCDSEHYGRSLSLFSEALLALHAKTTVACVDAFDYTGKSKVSRFVKALFRTRPGQIVVLGGGTYERSLVLNTAVRRVAESRILIVPAGNKAVERCQSPGGLGNNVFTVSTQDRRRAAGNCVDAYVDISESTSLAAAYAATLLFPIQYKEPAAPLSLQRDLLRQYTDPLSKRIVYGNVLKRYLPDFFPYAPLQWWNASCLRFSGVAPPFTIHVNTETITADAAYLTIGSRRAPMRYETTWRVERNARDVHVYNGPHHVATVPANGALRVSLFTRTEIAVSKCSPATKLSEPCILFEKSRCDIRPSCVWINNDYGCRSARYCDPTYTARTCLRIKACRLSSRGCSAASSATR